MKKVLITGEGSYIGTSFENYMKPYLANYQITTLSVIGEEWKKFDFDPYDVIFHVAGIAHADVGKVSEEGKQLYYQVNRDLTVAVAQKLAESAERLKQVKQFIFMSSIIVYGENTSVNKIRTIQKDTKPNPSSFYGDSKWQAELGLEKISSKFFKLTVLRPPMIYGPHSKGNYPQLVKIALKLPIFPNVKNSRSMLFVGNLCDFIKNVIDNGQAGIFLPHNKEIVRTSFLVREIAKAHGKTIHVIVGFNWLIKLLGHFPGKIGGMVNKAFGNLVIDNPRDEVAKYSFSESVKLAEEGKKLNNLGE